MMKNISIPIAFFLIAGGNAQVTTQASPATVIEAKIFDQPTRGILSLTLEKKGASIIATSPKGQQFMLSDSFAIPANLGVATLKRGRDGKYNLEENLSASAERWNRVGEDLKSNEALATKTEELDSLISKLDDLTKPARQVTSGIDRSPAGETPPVRLDAPEIKKTIDAATMTVEEAYVLALESNDPQATAKLASLYQSLREERKSLFGSREPDNYPPRTYKAIYQACFAVCKVIVDPEFEPQTTASGALIGPNLVLTCAHDVESGSNFEVVFMDEENRPVSTRLAERIYVGRPRSDSEGRLDFALLRIANDPADTVTRSPFVLSRRQLSLDAAIFSIGYPGGEDLKVHDYSRVVLPHELREVDRPGFLIRLQADFIRHNQLTGQSLPTERLSKYEFDRRYVRSQPGSESYFYHNAFHNTKIPVFGADTDTFAGDSGGPVVMRKNGSLVGILLEGMKEGSFAPNATIIDHERCLPMSVILRQLGATPPPIPGWPAAFGVQIEN